MKIEIRKANILASLIANILASLIANILASLIANILLYTWILGYLGWL